MNRRGTHHPTRDHDGGAPHVPSIGAAPPIGPSAEAREPFRDPPVVPIEKGRTLCKGLTSSKRSTLDNITVPAGYRLTEAGVERSHDKHPMPIAGPVWVSALVRDARNDSWGLLVVWVDHDGHRHEQAIARQRLHESSNSLAQELATAGLAIVPGRERALLTYLGAFEPAERRRSVDRLGWTDDTSGRLCYVLPKEVIAASKADRFVFQPERYSPSADTLHQAGSLDDWNYHVAARCRGNPLLVAGLCAAFASILLKPARLDGGGFHFYGRSSQGKTTLLQVAASVMGCGADPAEAPGRTSIHRWNATRNGLEGLAAAHNDGVLAMDELGSLESDDLGRVIYDLAGGQGKAAMDASRALKPQRAWRAMIISTGEVSASQRIREGRGRVMTGHRVRLMDLCTDDGLFVDTNREPPADFVNRLKHHCGQYFGTAGPAFITRLVDDLGSARVLEQRVIPNLDNWTQQLTPRDAPPEIRRGLRRLALLVVAGLLAQECDILTPSLDVPAAIERVRDIWLQDSANLPEGLRMRKAVQQFLLANGERFRDATDETNPGRPARDLCGYYARDRRYYLFTDDGFAEACNGFDPKAVARELAANGELHLNDQRLKARHTISIDGADRRIRLYAVKASLLDANLELYAFNTETAETAETSGTLGPTPTQPGI